jgi:hypothetical protein
MDQKVDSPPTASPQAASKHALDGDIINIRRGVAIYKTHASPFYQARIRRPNGKGYSVKSTKETSRLKAREVAEELAQDALNHFKPTPRQFSFDAFAKLCIEGAQRQAQHGERNQNYVRTMKLCLENPKWGLLGSFGDSDVRGLRTHHWNEYLNEVRNKHPNFARSTINTVASTFRNVLKIALNGGIIDQIPETPMPPRKDNPRPFFRFHPLVNKENSTWNKLLVAVREMADVGVEVRGNLVTDELYDLILFTLHTFVRPTSTELYALRHSDIEIADNPHRLIVTIRNGKTGHRISHSMPHAVAVYKRIKNRYPDASGEDFLFLPTHKNRNTAARIFQRQFNEALDCAGIEQDPYTGLKHSLYSIRHTAICMRLVCSGGEVNIYSLAKNAGTSVDQVERFYAKNLPLSRELARNLQSFGKR